METVLSWTHNGTVVNEDEDTTLSPMNLNHNLILHNTDVDDSGQYICRAVLDNEMVEESISVTVVQGGYIITIVTYMQKAMTYWSMNISFLISNC